MKLLISLLFFGINTILCGLCVAVDEEFYSGSDIIVEPDIPAVIRNDEFYRNMELQENIRDRSSFNDRTSDTVPYTNLNEQHKLNNDRWSNAKNLKKPKKFRQKNHIKTDITAINSTKSPSPKINHTHKVKVRRKKMKNRDDKIDVTTKKSINSLITMTTIKKFIENSTKIQQPQKIHSNNIIEMNEKIHKRNIFNSTKKRKNQFFKNENQDKFKTKQKIFKKRKSHRNHRNNNDNIDVGSNNDDGDGDGGRIGHDEKRKNRIVSHHELSDSGIVSLSNNTYRSQEEFVKDKNSLNYENRFSQVHQKRKHQQKLQQQQQQQHKDKNLNNFEAFKVKTNNYGNSYSNYYPDGNGNEFKHDFDDDDDDEVAGDDDGDDYGHDENRLNNERNFQKMKKINVFKMNKRQKLIAQEDNRKLLQAKRELKRKRKYERMERKKRKKMNNKNITETSNSPENIGYQQKQIDIIKNNNKNNVTENFVAQPSIDYFIEKPSNYFDINDTPTFGIIGVSVKSPTKNYISSENDISLSSSSSSSSSLSSSEILLEKMSIPIAVTVGKHTITNNNDDDDDNEKIEADISSITVKQDNTKMKNLKKISNNNDDDKQQNTMVVTIADRKAQNNDKNFDDDDDGDGVDGNNVKNKGDNNGNDSDKEETKNDKNILIEHENIGDLSCLKDDFQPAPEVLHADIKYLRNEEFGSDNAFLEIEYICHHGYKLEWNQNEKNSTKNIYCKNGQWFGTPPKCVYIKNILDKMNEICNFPERCEQLCYIENDIEKCTCHRGFRMKNNRCEDINECAENISVCEFGCINTVGSYQCKCPKGLRVGDVNSCIDVNECLLRNGHGPCQDTCINTWGGYKCSCDSLTGTKLSIDGHSCTDLDECTINNGGCSHTCINTMGRAFCLCPEGWTLDTDWKTCIDIDECAEDDNDDDNDSNNSRQKCEFGCINTPGSYSCLIDFDADQTIIEDDATECENGFYWNRTNENCEDINECSENNGGCYHECVNNIGSYHCSCRPGYTFDIDRYTCIVSNSSLNISCSPLFPPKHGYLECSRPISFDIKGSDLNNNNNNNNKFNNNNNNYYDNNYNNMDGQHSITNRPGSQCILRCPTGFRINGKFSKHCSNYGEWIGENNGTCIRYPKPKLICPSDIVLEPSPNQTMAKLKIPRPKTDVNYEQDVSVYPNWFHNSEIALEVGTRNVTYTARHPVSKLLVSCTFKVTVLEGEPPVVKFCPTTQKYTLSKQHDSIKIAWKEPIFMDNVNVTVISRTNNPGNSFGVGSHQIVYTAKDQAGHETKCTFKILVNVPYRPILNHPLPIYHMFYKKK